MIDEEKPAGSKPAAVHIVSQVLEGENQAAKGPGFDRVQARIPSAAGTFVDHVDVIELEYAAFTSIKAVSSDAKHPLIATAMEKDAPWIMKHTGALNALTDRAAREATGNGGQKNVARVWSVVSPSKRASTNQKKQEVAAANIRCSNYFNALVNEQEHGENEAGNLLELVGGDIVSKTEQTSFLGNMKEQQNFKITTERSREVKGQVTAALVNEFVMDRSQIVTANSAAVRGNDLKKIRYSNTFEPLNNEQGDSVRTSQHKQISASSKNKLQQSSPGSAKNQQNVKNSGTPLIASKDIVLVRDIKAIAAIESTATLQISDPELAQMIKESQAAMLRHTTPKIKAPLVTLNTSIQEVPSQSMESLGEQADDSGQLLLSTGNNQQVDKVICSISQASTYEVIDSKDQQGVTSASKTWADQVEEYEEDAIDSTHDDNTQVAESPTHSGNDHYQANTKLKEEAVVVHKGDEQVSISSSLPKTKGLSPNAAFFVPSG